METRLVDEPNGRFGIAGTLRNNGATEVNNVQVRLIIYDSKGKMLGSGPINTAPIVSIPAGAVVDFNPIRTDILKIYVARYELTVILGD